MNIAPLLNQPNLTVNNINNNNKVRKANGFNSAISFGSRKTEVLMTALEDSIDTLVNGSELNILNRMKFHRLLGKALPSIMVPENYINCGRQSKVYRIGDRYVAKVQRGYYQENAVHSYNTTSLQNKKFKQLDFYYGEPVVRVGKLEILKNATPTENHIFCGTNFRCDGGVSAKEIERYERDFIPMCSSVPQESYDNLAKNLKRMNGITSRNLKLQKETYMPDIINPNNLLISDNKFVLVDKLEKVPFENPNSVFTMLEPLLLRLNPEKMAYRNEELMPMRKNILKKILIATEKNDLPLDSPVKYEFSEWTFLDVMGPEYDLLDAMKRMRANGVSLQQRIETINDVLGK